MMDPYSMANLLMQAGYRPKAKRASRQVEELADALMTLGSSQVAMPVAGLVGGAAAPFVGAEGASEIIGDVQDRLTWRPRTERVQNAMQAFANAPPVQWLGQASQGLQQKAGDIGYEIGGPLGGAIGSIVPTLAEEAISRGLSGMRKPRVKSDITVYHGTPHKFDAFDSSKIGTGEGAQAYGHGLYFAESPDVAHSYVPKSKTKLATWGGKEVSSYGFDGSIDFADGTKGRIEDADWNAFRHAMENGPREGSLYHVDLPDDMVDNMLDWDKPLSQQPAGVQAKLYEQMPKVQDLEDRVNAAYRTIQNAGKVTFEQWQEAQNTLQDLSPKLREARFFQEQEKTGSGFYHWLAKAGNENASANLRQLGIPGIRYLDGGSRGTGTGTRNFVVFPGEEKRLRILRRE